MQILQPLLKLTLLCLQSRRLRKKQHTLAFALRDPELERYQP